LLKKYGWVKVGAMRVPNVSPARKAEHGKARSSSAGGTEIARTGEMGIIPIIKNFTTFSCSTINN